MIASSSNPRIKHLRRALCDSEDLDVFGVEGIRAVEEALRSGVKVEAVFYSDRLDATPRGLTLLESLVERGAEKVHVAERVLDGASATRQGQGIAILVHKAEWTLVDLVHRGRLIFVLDAVSDPGNFGTILRIADAFGLAGVITSPDTVDRYNDKVIRAAVGSVLRVPIVTLPLTEAFAGLQGAGYRILRAEAHDGMAIDELTGGPKFAVVLGNEAHGVGDETGRAVPEAFRIPTPGTAESLNVGVTAGIIAYALSK